MAIEVLVPENDVGRFRSVLDQTAGIPPVIAKNKDHPMHRTLTYDAPGKENWIWFDALELGGAARIY